MLPDDPGPLPQRQVPVRPDLHRNLEYAPGQVQSPDRGDAFLNAAPVPDLNGEGRVGLGRRLGLGWRRDDEPRFAGHLVLPGCSRARRLLIPAGRCQRAEQV